MGRRGVGQPVILECPAACPMTALDDFSSRLEEARCEVQHSTGGSSALTGIRLVLQLQPGSTDTASVTFDDFRFSAAD